MREGRLGLGRAQSLKGIDVGEPGEQAVTRVRRLRRASQGDSGDQREINGSAHAESGTRRRGMI
jgi:hypothetical protein